LAHLQFGVAIIACAVKFSACAALMLARLIQFDRQAFGSFNLYKRSEVSKLVPQYEKLNYGSAELAETLGSQKS